MFCPCKTKTSVFLFSVFKRTFICVSKQRTSWSRKVTFADAATHHMIKITSTPSLLPFLSSKRRESREIVFSHWFLESETSRLPHLYDAPPPTVPPGRRVTSHISSSIRPRLRGSTQRLGGRRETRKQSVPAAAATAAACDNHCGSSRQKRDLIRKKAFQRGRSQLLVKIKQQAAQNWCTFLNLRS